MENFRSYEDGNYFNCLDFQDFSSDYLLGEEALFTSHQHFCTSTKNSFLRDELDVLFEGDILSIWVDMEEDAYHKTEKAGGEKELKLDGDTVEKTTKMQGCPVDGTEKTPLTLELVSQYFYMPIRQAAEELNVGLTALKKRCRVLGIPRWPHRKVKSLQTLINNVQELGKGTGGEDMARSAVEMLQQTKKLIEQRPDVVLDEKTKALRQACFKESFKRKRAKRLMALEE